MYVDGKECIKLEIKKNKIPITCCIKLLQDDSLLKSGDVLAPTISELHGHYMCAVHLKTCIAQTRIATLEDENLETNCRYFTRRYARGDV